MDGLCQLRRDAGVGKEDPICNLGTCYHRDLLHPCTADGDRCELTIFEASQISIIIECDINCELMGISVVSGVPEGGPGREFADGCGPEQVVFEHRWDLWDEFNVLDAVSVPDGTAQHNDRPSDVYWFFGDRIHDIFAAVCAVHQVLCGAEHLSVLLSGAEPEQLPLYGVLGVVWVP